MELLGPKLLGRKGAERTLPTSVISRHFQLKIINMPEQQILGRHVLNFFICVLDQAEERIESSHRLFGTGYTIN